MQNIKQKPKSWSLRENQLKEAIKNHEVRKYLSISCLSLSINLTSAIFLASLVVLATPNLGTGTPAS